MQEMSKATKRRYNDTAFSIRYLRGYGLDIGAGDDGFNRWAFMFPLVHTCRAWDKGDGDAQSMEAIRDHSFDFVVSSHCLEHMVDPEVAMTNWIRILNPGGHLIVTIPDFDLYEGGQWPSRYNGDHKWAFTLSGRTPRLANGKLVNLLQFLNHFVAPGTVSLERLQLVRDFWNPQLSSTDQTLNPNTESCIEFVLRKNNNR